MSLVGATVSKVVGESDSILILSFDNGEVVKVFDSLEQNESYQIEYEGKKIIV